jgi:hypothetical protein
VKDLLKHLGIGNEAVTRQRRVFQQQLGSGFVRVVVADEIHRNVCVDADQPWLSR